MKWLISGTSGFLGNALAHYLRGQNQDVRGLLRRKSNDKSLQAYVPNDWDNVELLAKTMEGRDVFVHCAGLAHGKIGDMMAVNHALTLKLAKAAITAKLPHFIFISSVAVLGSKGHFSIQDQPNPHNLYAESKLRAEQDLYRLFKGSNTILSIIRPPMIIGHDAPGHATLICKLAAKNIPLPFADLTAKRSYITIDHLVQKIDVIAHAQHSALYNVTDEPVKARKLVSLIAQQNDLKVKLFWVPIFLFKALAILPPFKAKISPLIHDHVVHDEMRGLT